MITTPAVPPATSVLGTAILQILGVYLGSVAIGAFGAYRRGAAWGSYLRVPFVAVLALIVGVLIAAVLQEALNALWGHLFGGNLPGFLGYAVGFASIAAYGYFARCRTVSEGGGSVVLRRTYFQDATRPADRRTPRGTLTLAGHPVPPLDETKHFNMIGTTGTGKSTAIRELVGGALLRGDRAIFADPDGGYLKRF